MNYLKSIINFVSFSTKMNKKLFSCDFEVFGKVQGVFFRKYTVKKAVDLQLNGWCMNTACGSVKGLIEGPEREITEMKHWLANVGSPSSKVNNSVFSEMKEIDECSCKQFRIKQ